MTLKIDGIVPVMLTPFNDVGQVDYEGLANLTEWYLNNGADALFAVCQSSEMQFLSLQERLEIARFVVVQVDGRVPVIASGHVSDAIEMQHEELTALSQTGIDAIVLVTNRLDPENQGGDAFKENLTSILTLLPLELPLGLYECPAPFRRLLNDDELVFCRDSGRFVVLKDVSCDLETIHRRVNLVKGTGLNIVNANAAIAFDAMKIGSAGFAGVFTNFHPDLYAWLYKNLDTQTPILRELVTFLVLSACVEPMGYPVIAKKYHQKIGTFASSFSRAIHYDISERHWAVKNILEYVYSGAADFRKKIGIVEQT
jgi:4-hydroxy-tetrahydrodipicolinate synthase